MAPQKKLKTSGGRHLTKETRVLSVLKVILYNVEQFLLGPTPARHRRLVSAVTHLLGSGSIAHHVIKTMFEPPFLELTASYDVASDVSHTHCRTRHAF